MTKKEHYRGDDHHHRFKKGIVIGPLEAITHGDDLDVRTENMRDATGLKRAIATEIESIKVEYMDHISIMFKELSTRVHPHHFSIIVNVSSFLEAAQYMFEDDI